ncbi:putative reverse transcriptase domain-containing protein [Tanacetum coccineum]
MNMTIQSSIKDRILAGQNEASETDGQSERTIQTLEDMPRACVKDFGGSWDVHLPLVKLSYNNNYHSSMRCAPFGASFMGESVVHQSYGKKLEKDS